MLSIAALLWWKSDGVRPFRISRRAELGITPLKSEEFVCHTPNEVSAPVEKIFQPGSSLADGNWWRMEGVLRRESGRVIGRNDCSAGISEGGEKGECMRSDVWRRGRKHCVCKFQNREFCSACWFSNSGMHEDG